MCIAFKKKKKHTHSEEIPMRDLFDVKQNIVCNSQARIKYTKL